MDNQNAIPLTACLVKANLVAGTTSTLTTTGTTTYAIRGKAYTKAAITNLATPTTDYSTGVAFLPVLVNQGSVYMVGYDSGGNLKAIQGTITALDAAGLFVVAPQFGGMGGPAGSGSTNQDFCPIGYLVIKCGATFVLAGGWIFGTSNMSAVTGVTYTFVDVCGWPDRPQVA